MKMFLTASFWLWLTVISCAGRATPDTFAAFHRRVQRDLIEACECSPLLCNDSIGWRFFELSSRRSRWQVVVVERPKLSSSEWHRQYTEDNRQVKELVAGQRSAPAAVQEAMMAGGRLLALPGWHYKDIGLSVDLVAPDNHYPEVQRDEAEAKRWNRRVVKRLQPYPKS